VGGKKQLEVGCAGEGRGCIPKEAPGISDAMITRARANAPPRRLRAAPDTGLTF